MTPEERKRMNWLCVRIQEEKDPKIFDTLVCELNELLENQQEQIDGREKTETEADQTDQVNKKLSS
jgi:hypothetical protein